MVAWCWAEPICTRNDISCLSDHTMVVNTFNLLYLSSFGITEHAGRSDNSGGVCVCVCVGRSMSARLPPTVVYTLTQFFP